VCTGGYRCRATLALGNDSYIPLAGTNLFKTFVVKAFSVIPTRDPANYGPL